MDKESLLKQIAETGYNVGFGAKKHFATYDIVRIVPRLITFISLVFGILGAIFETFSIKELSAFLLVLGIISLYIGYHNENKAKYMKKGEELTQIFNNLKTLYFKVKSSSGSSFEEYQREFDKLSESYHKNSMSKQILFSGWYAHYKFFWEQQIDWIDEQKHFKFWRDKMPLSITIFLIIIILIGLVHLIYKVQECI